jgi:hypothetical protein
MKTMILVVAALGLATTLVSVAATAANTIAGDAQATRMQQTGSYSQ